MSKKYLFVVSLLLAITTFLVACSETEAADDQNGAVPMVKENMN